METNAAVAAKRRNQARLAIMEAVIGTIREVGADGVPAGLLYSAVMNTGMSLDEFESMMVSIVRVGIARKSGHCYYATEVK